RTLSLAFANEQNWIPRLKMGQRAPCFGPWATSPGARATQSISNRRRAISLGTRRPASFGIALIGADGNRKWHRLSLGSPSASSGQVQYVLHKAFQELAVLEASVQQIKAPRQ